MSSEDARLWAAVVADPDQARFVPDQELGLAGRLCRSVAAVRRAAGRHDLTGLRYAAGDLLALALQHRVEGVAWHARELRALRFEDGYGQARLYELLDGLEVALEHTLERLRLN